MTFAAVWALAGLVLTVPLVILHLRQRTEQTRDVPSLLLWHEFDLESPSATRRSRLPPLPLLLALQLLALILLVLTLAGPVLNGSRLPASTVVVLDDSYWMSAPGALQSARQDVADLLRTTPASDRIAIVLANGAPSVLYRGSATGASHALGQVRVSDATPDLSAALTVAAGLLTGAHDRMVVIHAPQDPLPSLQASTGELTARAAGSSQPDQGIFDVQARCGIGAPGECEVTATVANTGPDRVDDRVIADVPGRPAITLSTRVPGTSSTNIALVTTPGEQVRLSLTASDALSLDNTAWVAVPGNDDVPRPAAVTVVGTPADALSLAQAFAAVPGVKLRVRTPADYRAGVARSSDLVVLDGWLPRAGLPDAPAVMLVDPSRIPGGGVSGPQADTTLSGTDAASPLMTGVDLSSLTVAAGAARLLRLPRWIVPVLWSPSGTLLAAGDNGHTHLAVTAFQPGRSNLAQLAGFPLLATNIVSWGLGWAPAVATAGMATRLDALAGARTATLQRDGVTVARISLAGLAADFTAPAPGVYTLVERGPGIDHSATLDVNLGTPATTSTAPVDIRTSELSAGHRPGTQLAPWLIAAALLVLALEWAYWSTRRARVLV